jgi:hypothetical protein
MILPATSFATASLVKAVQTQLREARLRQRFAQHLAPAVVERIVSSPSVLKLNGERRQITALFTDIESFTAMTHRAHPEALVIMLDGCAPSRAWVFRILLPRQPSSRLSGRHAPKGCTAPPPAVRWSAG